MKSLLFENSNILGTSNQICYQYGSLEFVCQFLSCLNKTAFWYQLSHSLERLYYSYLGSVADSLFLGTFQGTSLTFVGVKARSTFDILRCVSKPSARLLPCC